MANLYTEGLGLQHSRLGGLRRITGRSNLLSNHTAESYDPDHFSNTIPPTEPVGHNPRFDGSQTSSSTFAGNCSQAATDHDDGAYSKDPSSIDFSDPLATSDDLSFEDFTQVNSSRGTFRILIWPAFVICVPMVMLAAALLTIVFKRLIKPVPNIFELDAETERFGNEKFFLVDFPATKLVFLASFLSTMAPLLAGCIMTLTGMLVYRHLSESSHVSHFPHLPTPYQMSLLIGVLAASYEQLFSCFTYLFSSKRTAKVSPVLLYAVSVFLLSVLLGIAVTVADAYLHIATETISVTLCMEAMSPHLEIGKGLSPYCLSVDRLRDNEGYPCSMAANIEVGANPDWRAGQAEIQRISHNTSAISTMHLSDIGSGFNDSIALLMSNKAMIPSQTNYRATTIGVSTKCSLISPAMCNLTRWGDIGQYTSFNCSSQFWGTLGISPSKASTGDSGRPLSPYLSFLAINQNANLIYNYFSDKSLETVYNTADLDASASQQPDFQPWPDEKLRNPVYMGLAWRASMGGFANSSHNGMVTSSLTQRYNDTVFIDYFLSCEVSTYEASYDWVNGSLHSLDVARHANGSILNIWTGTADYTPSLSGSDWNLQDYNVQSMIAGTTTSSYLRKFGELISQDALSAIAAYSSGRTVLQQQKCTAKLVAKVPKAALGALLACSLLYPVFGICLMVKAKCAVTEAGPMAPLFSYWGLTSAAFLEDHPMDKPSGTEWALPKPRDHEEALKLFVRKDEEHGNRFGLWRRSRAGHIEEIQRSRVKLGTWI